MARYVYVLVSDAINRYASLCFLSAFPIRDIDSTDRNTLLSHNITASHLRTPKHQLLPLMDNVIAIGDEGSPKYLSRLLKTTMLQHVREPFAFIDVDTLTVR